MICWAPRYYDAHTRRFLSKDVKLGDARQGQSLNRYVYALGNPVRFVDVSGFTSKDVLVPLRDRTGASTTDERIERLLDLSIDVSWTTAGSTPAVRDSTDVKRVLGASRWALEELAKIKTTNFAPTNMVTSYTSKVATVVGDALALFDLTVESALFLHEAALMAPEMSNIEALALVAGELTAMPWNLVTSPGRAIADFVVTRAYGDDPVELMRNRQVIDKWRVDGRQVKNFFEDQLAPVYDAIEQVGGQNLSTGWAGVRRH